VAILIDEKARTDLLNRLKRAEGQLRGVQRMIEEGHPCLDIASQMAAVRKALDSTYVRMTVCFMEQELGARLGPEALSQLNLAELLDDVQTLLGKVR
jgi:CsoR family transcriptional regulator, copper-sensing transcriptional repressor